MLLFITLLLLLFTLTSAFITGGNLYNEKELTTKGRVILFLGIASIMFTVLQYFSTKSLEDSKDEEVKQLQKDQLKNINEGISKNYQKIFEDLADAFKKQNLEFDSLRRKIDIIRDSARNINITNSPEENPDLIFCVFDKSIYIESETETDYKFAIAVENIGAKLYLESFDVSCVAENNTHNLFSKGNIKLNANYYLSKTGVVESFFTVDKKLDAYKFYFRVRANYKGIHSSKRQLLDEVCCFNMSDRAKYHISISEVEEKVRSYMSK